MCDISNDHFHGSVAAVSPSASRKQQMRELKALSLNRNSFQLSRLRQSSAIPGPWTVTNPRIKCDEAHFWLNGYVNKQNCRIWSEASPQVYVERPLHPEKLTVWCALWAGGILLQKR
ncbi:hypothetical protein TNCV_5021621 [Trichonephila clavipes]|nr:hypothetical protein TNCV_5021621 [Trichonephila clavipes]